MIAEVIVDVPAMGTDRAFDYAVPDHLKELIKDGIRVIVPFGPRKLTGFVVAIKESTDLKRIKPIIDVVDLAPVLNDELLQLGKWLADSTLCFLHSAYQSMLPAAMKMSYKRNIQLISESKIVELDTQIQHLFQESGHIDWDKLQEMDKPVVRSVQAAVDEGLLEVEYNIQSKGKKKKHKVIQTKVAQEELVKVRDDLEKRAPKQAGVLNYLSEQDGDGITLRQVMEDTGSARSTIKSLISKGWIEELEQEVYRDPYENRHFEQTIPLELTDEQQESIEPILTAIEQIVHKTFLLHGVTGSGKTEIYLQTIETVLRQEKEAIMLVPEISLTPQMVQRFKGRFGSKVAVLHSGLSKGEKYDEWRKIHRNEAKVVVGARSAIFAPFKKIGIIIIDEEHESSYKQEENPRYHARDVAIYRGNYHRCPVILGSATPTLETYARAQKGVYKLCSLQKRVNKKTLPPTSLIDMREELRAGNRSLFSEALFEGLKSRLERKEQSVLLLNRRGYSTFINCRDCGYVAQCPHCDISLTYHKRYRLLKCHYCGYEENLPTACPECSSEHIRFFGTGTQKVEEELNKLIPEATIIRMDVDTTSRKGMHEKLLNTFAEKKADILLGTQMIAKGLDFPDVTLVGVLAADTMLHLPDFRASERTFQLLTQVGGRAGRHELDGEVIIQTYSPEHYSIQLAQSHEYLPFYNREMKIRKLHQYPPFYYLALITVSHVELMRVVDACEKVASQLSNALTDQAIILGPVASPIPRVKDRYRYHCMIKYKNEPNLKRVLHEILDHYKKEIQKNGLMINVDMHPQTIM
ncbi:primosomal protein N' [Alkalihalobacillus sp. AL-G]|uniref:primosomal protein N' n=1 Tax=Alkalihalobacillus sp. AL-G TaxID=2926399 RepID=UPI00272D1042|nr:primosomal protein N' [Alkalihalobacillus sp. AL-G]WLD95103.1 primosomal protein N' [Alkalihalobacillus sp. AL-G]